MAGWGIFRVLFTFIALPVLLLTGAMVGGAYYVGAFDDVAVDTAGVERTLAPDEPTVVVGIEADDGGRVPIAETRAALDYWEAHESTYGDYRADFVLRPNATGPDVVVTYRSQISCPSGQNGCAPILPSADAFDDRPGVERVQVDADEVENSRMAVSLLTHEFGHLRGLHHCEEPLRVMGCSYSDEGEAANWRTRQYTWAKPNVTVYVASSDGLDAAGVQEIDAAIERVEDAPSAPDALTVTRTDSRWHADVVLRVSACDCRRYDYRYTGGVPYSADDDLEFLTYAAVRVRASDDRVGATVQAALSEVVLGTAPESGRPAGRRGAALLES